MSQAGNQNPNWKVPVFLAFSVTSIVLVLDQFTKLLAHQEIGPGTSRGPVEIISNVLQFRYVQNTGAAFGLFRDNSELLGVLSVGVVVFLAIFFRHYILTSRLVGFAFGLQFGGAIGNIIDRFRLGYVIDFIDVPRFPTFNVADMGITVGVTLLAFYLLFMAPEEVVEPDEDVRLVHPRTGASETGDTSTDLRDAQRPPGSGNIRS